MTHLSSLKNPVSLNNMTVITRELRELNKFTERLQQNYIVVRLFSNSKPTFTGWAGDLQLLGTGTNP
jgi:hypothetical protein